MENAKFDNSEYYANRTKFEKELDEQGYAHPFWQKWREDERRYQEYLRSPERLALEPKQD